ncbi:MAG: hypothetical protein ACJ8CR_10895 [Roseiflexaceae bacterium]
MIRPLALLVLLALAGCGGQETAPSAGDTVAPTIAPPSPVATFTPPASANARQITKNSKLRPPTTDHRPPTPRPLRTQNSKLKTQNYSYRSASIGFSRAARMAG